jgi:catechol 2,3-dioxygenase-like lactoylglutathione lyase family enzyme
MRILSTHHVALITNNFERLRAFYVETLELPVVGGFAGYNIIFLAAGSTAIELIEEEQPTYGAARTGWNHLALEVEDVDAAYAELAARGIPFTVLPEDFPSEAPQARIAFFRDPDGNLIELAQPLGARYPPLPGPAERDGDTLRR